MNLVAQVAGHGRSVPSGATAARLEANAANAEARALDAKLGQMERANPSTGSLNPAVQAGLGRMEQGGGAPTVQQLISNPGMSAPSRPAPGAAATAGGKPPAPASSPAAEVAASTGGSTQPMLFGGFNDSVQGGFGHMMVGSAIGGISSYATGGEFGQGMAMGAMGGLGVRTLHRRLGANSGHLHQSARAYADSGKMGSERVGSMLDNIATQGSAHSLHTMNQRKAMYMGAGLMGIMGGGDRNSHRRGFNSHRGNTF